MKLNAIQVAGLRALVAAVPATEFARNVAMHEAAGLFGWTGAYRIGLAHGKAELARELLQAHADATGTEDFSQAGKEPCRATERPGACPCAVCVEGRQLQTGLRP